MSIATFLTILSILIALLGFFVGYSTYLKHMRQDVKIDTTEDVSEKIKLNAKLDVLMGSSTKLENSFKEFTDKFDKYKDLTNTRITTVEEQLKDHSRRLKTKILGFLE